MEKKYKHSIMTDNLEYCYICGRERKHFHHIFGKYSRKACTADGLFIPVCLDCHIRIHNEPSKQLEHQLHKKGQEVYEKTHTRDEFMKRYGRNYL